MNLKSAYQRLLQLLILVWAPASFANGIFFNTADTVIDEHGRLVVTVAYDFGDDLIVNGGFHLMYDTESLEFVSYLPRPPEGVSFGGAFVPGELRTPGFYGGVGFSTKYFGGFFNNGSLGTFVFNIIGQPSGAARGCTDNEFICLLPNLRYGFFYSLVRGDVTEEYFDNDGTGLALSQFPQPVPVPAAIWLFLGSIGVLGGLARKP